MDRILVLLLALLPLYYGSVMAWSWAAVALVLGGALFVFGARLSLGKAILAPALTTVKWPTILFILVLVWIALQASPWTPVAWHHPLWQAAADALGGPYRGTISLDPYASWEAGLKLAAYGMMFLLAVQVGQDRKTVRFCVSALVWIIITYAVIVLVARFGFGMLSLWGAGAEAAQSTWGRRMAMPFVNPNHLAAYAGIGLVLCVGLMIEQVEHRLDRQKGLFARRGRMFVHLFSDKPHLVVGFILLSAVLLLTQSRAGVAAALVGLMVLVLVSMRAKLLAARIRTVLIGGLLLVGMVGTFGSFDDLLARAEREGFELSGRLDVFEQALDAVAATPIAGHGAGSFKTIARMYGDERAVMIFESAHSTLLELVVELGIPAAILLYVSVGMLLWRLWRGMVDRGRDQVYPVLAFAVSTQLLVHSIFDFPLQVPAIAYTLAFLLGLGVAQSQSVKKR